IVVYDGNPAHPSLTRLFSLIDDIGITFFGTSAKFIETLLKADATITDRHGLASMRTLASTGSPLSPEGFAFVYNEIAADVHLLSMSGGTDLCGCLVSGDPTGPVYSGQIQRPVLGMAIDVFDDVGRAVGPGIQGELVCTKAFPSMPLTFLGDNGRDRYLAAYFEQFENVWHQGDFAEWTHQGGVVIHGRSDATLNPGGVRIGTAEIYSQMEKIPEVLEGLVIGQIYDADTRIVLFVRLRDGVDLDSTLVDRIRLTIRQGATPRHVPAIVLAVDDLPRTRSGKIAEIAVREIVHGRSVNNQSALANPDALALFENLPELA
ncbi:MAG: AMP-binding protein, partial [Acidimicrobiaceae bacterium]|nr:AMP-binding protein [Acidimicrobiaceae bacterium]